jgi:aminoacrylate hydrolase
MEPVLLITGLGGRADFWAGQAAALKPRFEAITFDQRGRDRVEALARDALEVLDARGVERCHVVGHSLGGAVAQVIATDFPQRVDRLVLSGTWSGPTPPLAEFFRLRRRVLAELGADAYATLGALTAWPDDWLHEHPQLLHGPLPEADALLARIDAIIAFDRTAQLGTIKAPTLVICTEDDRVVPALHARRIAAGIPGSRLRLLPYGGHFPQVTRPEAYNELLLEFLEEA